VRTVGSFEATTHLPGLLDEVAKGATVTITKHGVPVAMLVPVPHSRRRSTREVIEALREFRRDNTLGDKNVRELIEEGRRF
jgi:prevent-host-death family protein